MSHHHSHRKDAVKREKGGEITRRRGELLLEKKNNMCQWLLTLDIIPIRVKDNISLLHRWDADTFADHFVNAALPALTRAKAMGPEAYREEINTNFGCPLTPDVLARLERYYSCFEDILLTVVE